MNFYTKIPVHPQQFNQIDYNARILLLGSCFSENIAKKLSYFKFQNMVNPFGILFHPKAIETFITNVINQKVYLDDDVFYHNELWHCFEGHSRLSHPSKSQLLEDLNTAIRLSYQQLQTSSHIILTFGTSWIYRFIETDNYVANCHKVPQKKFLKELFSVTQITESLDAINALIKSINPNVTIINTVSPVRHLKDGFTENTISKSHLIAAIQKFVGALDHQYYFPSYELMMDELRDYRFYNSDMIHPNETAIQYIWEHFKAVWINEDSYEIIKEIDSIQKGLAHKAFHPNSEAHRSFLEQLEHKISQITSKLPNIKF